MIPGTDIPSTGSAKNDAYRWAAARYLDTGRCSREYLAYYLDSYWFTKPMASGAAHLVATARHRSEHATNGTAAASGAKV